MTTIDPLTVEGGFTALHPVDGLFLRAEHLETIQAYSRQISHAIGISSGTGVVFGFDIALDPSGPSLEVLPGLAIGPTGLPLRSIVPATLSLAAADLPAIGTDGFWVIEVDKASWQFGNENVYGNLCDDPCSGGASIKPFVGEGVTITARADDMPGLAAVRDRQRRNWLASQYFERERKQGTPWLVPGGGSQVVSPLATRDWTRGIGQPVRSGVPIGAIQLVNGEWILDVWTARRDICGRPADDAWRWRLAMRPWSVFLAQVLQFQDQLTALDTADFSVVKQEIVDPRAESIRTFIGQLKETPVGEWRILKDFETELAAAPDPSLISAQGHSLSDLGVDELPPAGYIGGLHGRKELAARVALLFGDGVELRLCRVRADHVAGAVEAAQHLDRIPLRSDYGKPAVDILVPVLGADLEPLVAADYGWVAFVRRSDADCGRARAVDPVDVYEVFGAVDDTVEAFKEGRIPDEARALGQLEYPADSWEFPGGDIALEVDLNPEYDLQILTIAADERRRPLAALRGALFAASLDEGRAPPPVTSIATDVGMPEAIVVIQSDNR